MRASFIVLLGLIFAAPVRSAPAGPDEQIDALIAQLASPDPRVRENASSRLLDIGEPVRGALRRATASSDPAIASAAQALLQRLPWSRPNDPPVLKLLLGEYGDASEQERIQIIGNLAELSPEMSADVLLRLARDDPYPQVGWRIVFHLRRDESPIVRQALAALDTDDAGPAILALAGWAKWRSDPSAAAKLFAEAIELAGNEDDDFGELRVLTIAAVDAAVGTNQFDLAAQILRRRAFAQDPDVADVAAMQLLALHIDRGPLTDWPQDLESLRPRLGQPLMLAAQARLHSHAGRALLADGFARAATAVQIGDASETFDAADHLLDLGWLNPAAPWLMLALDRATAADDDVVACNVHLRLQRIAKTNRVYRAAADHLEKAFSLVPGGMFTRTDRIGNSEPWTSDEILTEIQWLHMIAAREAGDDAEVAARVDALLQLAHVSSDVTLELLVMLHADGRLADQQALFDRARAVVEARLSGTPDDPAALNNAAWLMARSGMAVPEALKLARRAVALDPRPGYLDTLAEAEFRSGNVAEALRLETRALQLRPDDAFFVQQIERFRTTKPDLNPLTGD